MTFTLFISATTLHFLCVTLILDIAVLASRFCVKTSLRGDRDRVSCVLYLVAFTFVVPIVVTCHQSNRASNKVADWISLESTRLGPSLGSEEVSQGGNLKGSRWLCLLLNLVRDVHRWTCVPPLSNTCSHIGRPSLCRRALPNPSSIVRVSRFFITRGAAYFSHEPPL